MLEGGREGRRRGGPEGWGCAACLQYVHPFTLEPLTSAMPEKATAQPLRGVRSPAGISFLSPRSINLKKTIMLHQSGASFSPRETFLHQVITW